MRSLRGKSSLGQGRRVRAGRLQGCRALICMPVVSPEIKVQAVERLGGLVQLVGETYTETQAYAQVGAHWSALRQ